MASEPLQRLVARYDPQVFDANRRVTRIRLATAGGGAADAVIVDGVARLEAADGEPDAVLTADAETWRRMAADLRGGMDAFNRSRLSVRTNLHVGVGFLAATSGATTPGRLEFKRAPGCPTSRRAWGSRWS
jgi:hypothetical protein